MPVAAGQRSLGLWGWCAEQLAVWSSQVIDLTRQQEVTKQQEFKTKEAEYRAQAAVAAKVSDGGT